MLIDSHCHLDMLDCDRLGMDVGQILEAAKDQGVEKVITIGVDLVSASRVIDLARQYPQVSASFGLHPSESTKVEPSEEDYMSSAADPHVVAIGEMGLDYYYDFTDVALQQERFRRQIRVAREVKKPIIIHTRNAKVDTLNIMREEKALDVGGVMHCFTEDLDMAKQAMDLGFYISFSGIVTFKKAENVREVASQIPLDRMLVETDAPYLTPVPKRGKPNQPAHVKYVADFLADFKKIPKDLFYEKTYLNTQSLFKLD